MAIPERNMFEFVSEMALLETLTSMLGKTKFIWATTVLLGGFVSSLSAADFLNVSIILVLQGIWIFGRTGDLQTGYSSSHNARQACMFGVQVPVLFLSLGGLIWTFPKFPNLTQNIALQFFYLMSLMESALFMLGAVIILHSRWVLEVKEGYNLNDSQINTLYGFFYNTYSRCVHGDIFDSSMITIVSYNVELLQSSDGDEQLKGATLLRGLVKKDQRALERLRSVGTIRSVVEMLIDMLNWDSNESPDKDIREAAAEIISKLVEIGRNRTLVMAAPNSMESIASLLDDGDQVENIPQGSFLCKEGLRILNQLANDHDNSAKMGSNRGILLKIITLTESNAPELELKILAISTLTSIARDQEFRESIGGTEGVLRNFFSLFFVNINIANDAQILLVSGAGEALGFLSLENHHNCEIMMNFPYLIPDLISALNDPVQGTYAARILRNLYAYLEAKSVQLEANSDNLNATRTAPAEVVRLVMEKEGVHQEAAIGLAAQIFNFLSQAGDGIVLPEQEARSLILRLRDVLQQYASPSKELPNIRRFSILLLIAVMKMHIIPTMGDELQMDLMNALEGAINTTSVLESYSTFSGTVGLSSHRMSIPFLAYSAMELLHPELARRHRRQYPEPTRRDRENNQPEVLAV